MRSRQLCSCLESFFFAVLCNNPSKYAVVEPEGKIGSCKCADIVVRHVAVSAPQSLNQTDKFRIQMYEQGNTEPISRKEVLATLHPGENRRVTNGLKRAVSQSLCTYRLN